MIRILSRRAFVSGASCLGAGRGFWTPDYPAPRVWKLSQWRSLPRQEELEPAFEFITSAAVDGKAPGRYPIDGDRVYAAVAQGRTRAPEAAQFEAHRRYIDVHYLVRGKEMIGSAAAAGLRPAKPYDPESEAALYERPAEYQRLVLNPGEFTVFFPGQAHMPGCDAERSEEIKKVVVKILAKPG